MVIKPPGVELFACATTDYIATANSRKLWESGEHTIDEDDALTYCGSKPVVVTPPPVDIDMADVFTYILDSK